jgi:hypothetical protein
VLAFVRPDAWNIPLLVHVLGAMLMTAGVLVAALTLVANRAGASALLSRVSFRSLLVVALPGYVLMRVGAEWIFNKENISDKHPPSWVDTGFIVADPGLLLLIIATVIAWRVSKRVGAGNASGGMRNVVLGLSGLLVVMYVVAIYAMTTKPT